MSKNWKQELDQCEDARSLYNFGEELIEELDRLNDALLKIKSMDDTQAGLTQYSLFNQARIIVEEALAYHEDKI